ncbi:transposase [Bradyrhizobium sp. RDM4]|uniref:transposase n=1 Tax=Bradyrhizobium sp. RDM4 TaxID=3378765 RepID=UPI0038FD2266
MYRLFMAIRPDALPSDTAALTEMVLALDAENEKLRVAMRTLKEMIFGKRSERLATLVAEQLALELDDLETGATPPAAANDAPAARPSGQQSSAERNAGDDPRLENSQANRGDARHIARELNPIVRGGSLIMGSTRAQRFNLWHATTTRRWLFG